MCIDKENFKISIQDVIDFISDVLEKITNIPGVGEVMTIVDKAMEAVMGFVEDLIPEVSFFPEFNIGISVDFLDFGGLSSAFDKVKLP